MKKKLLTMGINSLESNPFDNDGLDEILKNLEIMHDDLDNTIKELQKRQQENIEE